MRFLLLALALCLTTTASAQLRFTPTPVEQRLDSAESRIDNLEAVAKQLVESNKQIIALLATQQVRQQAPKPQLASAQAQPQRTIVQPQPLRYTQAELAQIAYNRQFSPYPLQHIGVNGNVWDHLKSGAHGFSSAQVDRLNFQTASLLHSMEHAGEISPYKTRTTQPVQATQLVTTYVHPQENRVRTGVQRFIGGCVNGQCIRRIFR